MERSVNVGTFSSTVISSNNDEIERISDSSEIILLELMEDHTISDVACARGTKVEP